eukprot:c26911_g1_i1.p1 GENE.c26911_g1_i1~~c26911_g1_i1.p1  ORF type:complete len:315 (+),score=39.91 c26911_g1_i1:121-1065(+)
MASLPREFAPFLRADNFLARTRDWVVILLMAPIALIRVILLLSLVGLVYLVIKITFMMGLPSAGWLLSRGARLALFLFGFTFNVRWRSEAARLNPPRILVCNHLSYLDILILMALFPPSFVAKGPVRHIPCIGLIARAMRCVFVEFDDPSGPGRVSNASAAIQAHVRTEDVPPMCLFPEGTTTNGTVMLSFKRGAFVPGVPVLPLLIRYPHEHFNPSWEVMRVEKHILLLLSQVFSRVTIDVLEPYVPTETERLDSDLYAANVCRMMATELGVPIVPVTRRHKLLLERHLRGELTLEEAHLLVREEAQKVDLQE